MIVSASLLSCDFMIIGEEMRRVIDAGANWIHLDCIDGNFAPNLSFGPPLINSLRKCCNSFLDAHLMISEPEKIISTFINAGVNQITLHYESTKKLEELIKAIKYAGIKAGIAINPGTDVKVLDPFLSEIDLVLILGVNPGFSGQKLIPETLEKVKYLDNARNSDKVKFKYLIQFDGGVNDTTIDSVIDAGVDVVVAGSYIFKSPSYNVAIKKLKKMLFLDAEDFH